ncbi:cell division cycle protein-like protein [Cryomyces antarcticus]|uniref:Cell division cycle protein 123 n=1 Tax=Cryomyces antarcticus TaxID=329879 RepID=A0ABR0KSJ7_9PEZI|nr:hypothetical protein LTR60_002061 [Cryomyces antarcticus]KAK5125079.1 hypothetical protein LTR16_003388 [Cryomyces antarcticus]
MPVAEADLADASTTPQPQSLTRLPFPQCTRSHILHCSYHYWHPKYRAITPKARLIPLSQPFLDYLRADGIILPPDDNAPEAWSDSDSGIYSSTDNPSDSEDEDDDPSAQWREIHQSIKSTIAELGGKVVPKLNWSAPKDATWINATNSMECRTPSDIYLLLKSSDFVTHDLEHAFDDCEDYSHSDTAASAADPLSEIPYHLVLRKYLLLNPSVEFRCFVRNRKLIALCQRDLNHFEFLFKMQSKLRDRIQKFFDEKLRDTFPDENFTFDVYVPPPHDRVWLIDLNPWAIRTDPLIFSWMELLTMPEPRLPAPAQTVRIPLGPAVQLPVSELQAMQLLESDSEESLLSEEEAEEDIFVPEFRLVKRDDPEAYNFNTPQFSAHKLPREVVDASKEGVGGLREFADQWKEILAKRQQADQDSDGD